MNLKSVWQKNYIIPSKKYLFTNTLKIDIKHNQFCLKNQKNHLDCNYNAFFKK